MTPDGTLVPGVTAIAVAVDADGPLVGVALLGPSGSGKSTAALTLVEACPHHRTRLIADDAAYLRADAGSLLATAPAAIAGAAELRGTGILRLPVLTPHPLSFAFDLAPVADRLPEPATWSPLDDFGPALPMFAFPPRGTGVRAFLRSILSGHSARAGFDCQPAFGSHAP